MFETRLSDGQIIVPTALPSNARPNRRSSAENNAGGNTAAGVIVLGGSAVGTAVRDFHDKYHGRGGGPFSRPGPIALSECNDPRCLALARSEKEEF